MNAANIDKLRAVKPLPSLVAYLRDELGWPGAFAGSKKDSVEYPAHVSEQAKAEPRNLLRHSNHYSRRCRKKKSLAGKAGDHGGRY